MSTSTSVNGIHNNDENKHNIHDNECLHDLEETIKKLQKATNFNRVASKMKAVSASPRSIIVELEIDESHVNSKGTLHGGQTAALLDIVTARAVGVTIKDTPMVSLELSVSYLLPVKIGESILIEGIVLKAGRNVAFTEAEFRRKSDNALVAKGKHTISLLHYLKHKPGEAHVEQF